MHDTLKELIERFNELETDTDKYRFLIAHPGVFKLHLDNDSTDLGLTDSTCSHFTEAEISDFMMDTMGDFDDGLGWHDGIISLLAAVGIDGEPV